MIILEATEVTDIYTLIYAVIGIVGTNFGLYLKQRWERKKEKEDQDLKQQKQINELKAGFVSLKDEFGLLKDELKLILPVIHEINFEKDITTRLNERSYEFISSNDYLKRDMRTFLLSIQKKVLGFAIHNFISHGVKDQEYYTDIINSIVDDLKIKCLQIFTVKKIYKDKTGLEKPIKFAYYIREKDQIKLKIVTLMDRLLNNSHTTDQYIELFEDYLKDFYKVITMYWRDFNDLPNELEKK